MAGNGEQSPKEEITSRNHPAWIFDELVGWIDVNEFLLKAIKLSEEVSRRINKCEKI